MRLLARRIVVLLWAFAACSGGGGSTPPAGPTPVTTSTTTTTAAPQPPPTTTSSTTTTAAPAQQVIRQASFESANGYMTQGTVQIVRTGDRFTLELLSDFRTSQSPALDVRLCVDVNCRGSQLDLGALRAFSGSQTYGLPNDGGSFTHAVIYCRAVQLAFGFGVLR